MATFLHITVIGLVVGSIYALTATGIVVTYTTSGIFNFAHGAVGMFAAWTYWQFRVGWGWPVWASLIVVLGVIAPLIGLVIERVLIRPLHGAAVDLSLVVTVGLFLALIGATDLIWKQTVIRVMPSFFPGKFVRVAGFNVTYDQLVVVAVAVAVAVGLRLLFSHSRIGIAMRAVVDDPELVAMAGGSPVRARQLSWALGTTLASLSGVLLAPIVTLTVIPLTLFVINGYAAAMVGRLRSLPMTVLGALFVGLGYNYLIGYAPNGFLRNIQLIIPMIVLFVVLIVLKPARLRLATYTTRGAPRPAGLLSSVAWGGALVLAAAVIGPHLSVANLRTASHGMGLALIMLSLVVLTGYGGMVSLCQMTFVGLGAYAMSHVGSGGSPLGLLAAAGLAAGFGVLVAVPTLRLRGLYLALATLAFAQMMDTIFFNNVLGEGGAIVVPRPHVPGLPRGDRAYFVELAAVFAVAGIGVLALRRGRFGRRLAAMSDSPAGCATLGLNVHGSKLAVFTVSAAMAGVAGALYAAVPGQASNNDFVLLLSLTLLLLARIGGINTVSGAFLGAAVFTAFQILQSHHSSLTNIQYLLTGLGAISLGRDPNGMGGRVAEIAEAMRSRFGRGHAPVRAEPRSARTVERPDRAPSRTPLRPSDVPMLELIDVHASYGRIEVVHGVSFSVPRGSVFALLGPNGAGKSTTLKVIGGALPPTSGCVHVAGTHLHHPTPDRLARAGVCRMPEGRGIFPNLTVTEHLRMWTYATRVSAGEVEERAFARFPRLGERRSQLAGTLSGGEQQMLAMSRTMAGDPGLLLLDELSMGLAPLIVGELYDLVRILASTGVTVLLVEQFARTALEIADHAAVMTRGRVDTVGRPEDVRAFLNEAYLGVAS